MASRAGAAAATQVYLEIGSKRVFACAVDWPGWCRSGPDEHRALAALGDYASRYAPVAEAAGARFPTRAGESFAVAERVAGSGTTDFGAPGSVPDLDSEPLTRRQAERLAALVAAAWQTLDAIVVAAPAELRKGPRGGGRDRDAVAQHVVAAEAAYARKLGVRHKEPAFDDVEAVRALRGGILDVLRLPSDGAPLLERGWPARYAARRIAWHALDHAWEIEDKSQPA